MGQNAIRRENLRKFLLGFFKQDIPHKDAIEINGFVVHKHWRGDINEWTAELFTKESYKRMISFTTKEQDKLL